MDANQYLALLRGVNVGGKNKLPMKDLVALFIAAGCDEVRTYIQSGNILFRAAPAEARRIPALIASRIAAAFGYQTPVVLRTSQDLRTIVSDNPFLKAGATEDSLHVLFLADSPTADRIESLDPHRSPPDSYIVRGREIYLQTPAGLARSKLTNAYFDSRLATVSTGRNWRTVTTLLQMMDASP